MEKVNVANSVKSVKDVKNARNVKKGKCVNGSEGFEFENLRKDKKGDV